MSFTNHKPPLRTKLQSTDIDAVEEFIKLHGVKEAVNSGYFHKKNLYSKNARAAIEREAAKRKALSAATDKA